MTMLRRMRAAGKRGQVAVETAIVMPLFTFTILGILQLTLMHQAQVLTKYAAYKAVRAGSINRGKVSTMENAALAVLVPVAGRGSLGGEGVYNVSTPAKYAIAYQTLKALNNVDKIVEVTICGPNKATTSDNFDDYRAGGKKDGSEEDKQMTPEPENIDDVSALSTPDRWENFDRTKLSIQVTLNYRMSIPFVNGLIWWASYTSLRGSAVAARKESEKVVRLGDHNRMTSSANHGSDSLDGKLALASQKIYVMPIRAGYVMRMQSNFEDAPPSSNKCKKAWKD